MAKFSIYHTLENRGNFQTILDNKGIKADTTDLFLGEGYYYWEDNFDHALIWGQKRYRGNFYVFMGLLEIDLNITFDISSMSHNNFIKKMYSKFKTKYAGRFGRQFYLGNFIDFLIDWQNDLINRGEIKEDERFFPFKYSKGIDHSSLKKADSQVFSKRDPSWYYNKPVVFFCIYDKKDLILYDFKLIKTAGVIQI